MRWLAVAAALLGAGCGSGAREYGQNDLQLLTQYAAKELCSCLFVMERDAAFCAAWARQAPDLKTWDVDFAAKRVRTQAVLFFSASARYHGPRRGCIAEQ